MRILNIYQRVISEVRPLKNTFDCYTYCINACIVVRIMENNSRDKNYTVMTACEYRLRVLIYR